ncbi:iron dependent repressor, metal binding and dimerization domain protein [Cerasicoccus maritimus]|uniref:iron dependent repressor, metal binding and dimerization domain protein n=1 Tax=Cerasicoccus maritimus TaxID=490089 RepID=UPI002852B6A9|nr:iron dependent repressor, metal binding and dimerization domain protein [Cerasicoccus maritimus]
MKAAPNKQSTARRHQRVRKQHSNELAQDYVEAIHQMTEAGQPPRVTDLQEIFGVSHVSVVRALQRFEKRGLLNRSSEEGLILTDSGRKMALEAQVRHNLVVDFLLKLGVSDAQAHADAEGLEHHISDETLSAMQRFLDAAQ